MTDHPHFQKDFLMNESTPATLPTAASADLDEQDKALLAKLNTRKVPTPPSQTKVSAGMITTEDLGVSYGDFLAVAGGVWNHKDGPEAAVRAFNELFERS